MTNLKESFEERKNEISEFLELLKDLETFILTPITGNAIKITQNHQKILSSNAYLMLYNIVESTMTSCQDALSNSILEGNYTPNMLTELFLEQWVNHYLKIHDDSTNINSKKAFEMSKTIIEQVKIKGIYFKKELGNWHDTVIENFLKQLGVNFILNDEVNKKIKKHVRDEKGALEAVKDIRNKLSHGRQSFIDCGSDVTYDSLSEIAKNIFEYLEAVIKSFENAISNKIFLKTALQRGISE